MLMFYWLLFCLYKKHLYVVAWSLRNGNGNRMSSRAVDDGQGTLTISNVRPEDEGTYICTGSDFYYAEATDEAVLTVTGNVASSLSCYTHPMFTCSCRFIFL